jgi:peptide/nickel transport system substrate-binding protein
MQSDARHAGSSVTRRFFIRGTLGTILVGLMAACAPAAAPGPPPTAAPATAAPPVPTSPPAPTAPVAPTAAKPAAAVAAGLAPTSPPPAPTPAAATTPTPRSGGSLTVGTTLDIDTLDGHRLSGATGNWRFMTYDALITYDGNRQPQPMLAESWDTSPDDMQLKVNLRKGVQFHSGRELTSDDVKWNILRVRDPKVGASQLLNMSNWFTDVQTPDKYTLVLISDQPRPAAFDLLEYLSVLDPVTMQGPDAQTKVVGTGPFVLEEATAGSRMRFSRNSSYWRSGRPYLDEVVLNILKDTAALSVSLEAGANAMALFPPLDDALRLQQDPAYRILFKDSGYNYGVWANTTVPPTDNKLVRQAMNYAIDRNRWVQTYLHGVAGQARDLPWPPSSPAADEQRNAQYAFDLDKARSLLQSSGVTNLDMDLLYPTQSGAPVDLAVLAQMYQQDAAQIGVNMTLKPLDLTTFNSQVINRQYQGMFVSIGGFDMVDPGSFFSISVAWNPKGNTPGYSSDQYTQLINSASTETDPAKRRDVYNSLNDLILDESFGMMVSSELSIFAMRAAVHDFGLRYTGYNVFTDTWLEA